VCTVEPRLSEHRLTELDYVNSKLTAAQLEYFVNKWSKALYINV